MRMAGDTVTKMWKRKGDYWGMDILLWHEILEPYELAVKELTVKFNHLIKEHHEKGL